MIDLFCTLGAPEELAKRPDALKLGLLGASKITCVFAENGNQRCQMTDDTPSGL